MECFGINWQIGRPWGNYHPEHICWNAPESIVRGQGRIGLGVDYNPMEISVPGYINQDAEDPDDLHRKLYPWSVGYLTSLDTFKYGYFRMSFRLPIGNHLWPAIWLSDSRTWPPEVDIMEGWTGYYGWQVFKPKSARRMYRTNPVADRIFPSVHIGTDPAEHTARSYRRLGGTPVCYLDITGNNICEFIWSPDRMVIYYNKHKVMEETDPEILRYYNECHGMKIHLNNYVTNDFTMADFRQMESAEDKGFCRWFYIYDVRYDPDYELYSEKM